MGPVVIEEGGRVVGFLDLGTNSIRLLLVRINPNRSFTVLLQQRHVVRLGEGAFEEQQLQEAAMCRAVLAARGFMDLARAAGAKELVAVATSATRDAENREVFLERMQEEAGVDMRVISGREEARLIYLGVASGLSLEGTRALFIDIGGGSTEVSVGDQRQHYYLDTLKLGAIRLATMYFRPSENGPVSDERYALIKQYVLRSAARCVQHVMPLAPKLFVGSSGTIMNLAEITVRRKERRSLERNERVRMNDLRETIGLLRNLPLEQRRKVPGINPERADIIIPGAAVIDAMMESFGAEEIVVSDRGLREGLLVDYLERIELFQGMPVREQSVFQLGRSCGFDEEHAHSVTRFSLTLFDDARNLGLHRLTDAERELLRYASLLHDVGIFISFSNHQAHSYYLMKNAEMLGFDQKEINTMAAIAFYHRKKPPRKKHPEFAALDKRSRRVVTEASVFLNLAESLERGRSDAIRRVSLREQKGRVLLEIEAVRECQIEVWGVEESRDLFERAFGRELVVVARRVDLEEAEEAERLASGDA